MRWYVVGKGPSLAHLGREHFEDGVILTLNSALAHIEGLGLSNRLVAFQLDGCGRIHDCQTCSGARPPARRPSDTTTCVHDVRRSVACNLDHPLREAIDPTVWGFEWCEMSVRCALEYALEHGATEIVMLCFDSFEGEYRSLRADGLDNGENGVSYRYVNPLLLERLRDVPHTIVIPKAV